MTIGHGGLVLQPGQATNGMMLATRPTLHAPGMAYALPAHQTTVHLPAQSSMQNAMHSIRQDVGQPRGMPVRAKVIGHQQTYSTGQQPVHQPQQQLLQQGYPSLQMSNGMMLQQQPYIIQGSGGQQYLIDNSNNYDNLASQPQDNMSHNQQQGQYMNMGGQTYTLQTVQLPAGTNIQDYLQLSNNNQNNNNHNKNNNQEVHQGGTIYMLSNLQAINLQGLAAHTHTQDGGNQQGMHVMHQQ